MTRYFFLALCLCAASGFGQRITTRINEREVTGLPLALDSLSSSATSLTNRYIQEAAIHSYVSNAAFSYITQYLPGLITHYTYPFTTEGVVFDDGTLQTFGRLTANHIDARIVTADGKLVTSGTNVFSDAYLLNTLSISNLTARTADSSLNAQIGHLKADTADFSTKGYTQLNAPSVAGHSLSSVGSSGGVISSGTNALVFTGDVFISVRDPILDHYRNPILVRDPVSGNTWYDPSFVRPNGTQISLAADAVEMRAFPRNLTGHEGYAALGSTASNRVPRFSYGPVGVSLAPRSLGFMDTLGTGLDYLLSVYAVPATPAGLQFKILAGRPPELELPPYPEMPPLPPLIPPWVAPPLPELIPWAQPSPARPPPPPPPTYSGMFYDPSTNVPSATLGELYTDLLYLDYILAYYTDDWDAAERAAIIDCAEVAREWYGRGATGGNIDAPLSLKEKRGGFLIYPAATEMKSVEVRRRGPGDGLPFSASSSVTIHYERAMYGCSWVGIGGTPVFPKKTYQNYSTTTTKYAAGPSAWWNLWYDVRAYAGYLYRSSRAGPPYNGWMGPVLDKSISEQDLPTNRVFSARSTFARAAPTPNVFYVSGDTVYAFDNFGSTYRTVYDPTAAGGDIVTYYLLDSGTSLYDPGVPEFLARQFIYEEVGDGTRATRNLVRHYEAGDWVLWQDRTALYVQRAESPVLQFLRHYDSVGTPVMDVSNNARPFVVDNTGSPGESGYGSPEVEMLFVTSLAEEVTTVTPTRNAGTGAVSYAVTVNKRRPQ